MIRFSAFLVAVAFGLLIAGAVTSKLLLVYVAIAVSGVALVLWAVGVALKRQELFADAKPADASVALSPPVPAQATAQSAQAPAVATVPPSPSLAGYLPTDQRTCAASDSPSVPASLSPPTPSAPSIPAQSWASTRTSVPAQPSSPPAEDQPQPVASQAPAPAAEASPPSAEAPAPAAEAAPPAEDSVPITEPSPSAPSPAQEPREPREPQEPQDAASEAPASADAAEEREPKAAPAELEVTVVPGVPRYHNARCILIRFMGEDDLEKMTLAAAKEAGCTPCRACLPDQPEKSPN